MSQIMESLRQDHENFAELIRALDRQLAVFDEADRPDYELMSAILEFCQRYPDAAHHPTEDLVFRKLKERDPESAAAVGDQEAEHEIIDTLTDRLATMLERILNEQEVPREAFDHATRTFIDNYWRHMTMEEKVFFPRAEEVLSEEDWREIDRRWSEEIAPKMKAAGKEFEDLREQIAAADRDLA